MYLLVGACFLALAATSRAAVNLSAAVSYGADGAGSSTTEPGEFDNINGSGNFALTINGQPRGTTFLLNLGTNDFTFTGVSSPFNALSLYSAPTGDPFSRPSNSMPDLVGYTLGTGALTPAVGSQVQTNGTFSGTLPWSGASIYSDGSLNVSFTDMTYNGNNAGTFQLTVAPAPEPTLGAAAFLAVPLLAPRRRR
jgi:hypothetical protein